MNIDSINQHFAGVFFALFLAGAYFWLRDRDEYFALLSALMKEAADEIEKLTRQRDEARAEVERLRAEIEKLRAKVAWLEKHSDEIEAKLEELRWP